MPFNNKAIIASAGSRKTTYVIENALINTDKKVLITTYTRENLTQIKERIISAHGVIPDNLTIDTWFSFLLTHGVRPYQMALLPNTRVKSIDFETRIINRKGVTREEKPVAFYLTGGRYIYKDRVSDFICQCNKKTNGAVIQRLEKIFDYIYIDEIQDIAGWDQNFVELLMLSKCKVIVVGDPRQSTYTTNNALKNKSQKGQNITQWIMSLKSKGICSVEEHIECFRSNQIICDFADALFPELPKTISRNEESTGHDGIFIISANEVEVYIEKYSPQVLRWNKNTNTLGYSAINIGVAKGRTFDRVLIFPTSKMKEYLKTKDLSKAGDLSKFYVAVTRAKYSVAFVVK